MASVPVKARIKGTPIKTKRLTCIRKMSCKNGFSVKDIDTSGYIVVSAIYTSHTDQSSHKHAVFECSAVCLSVIFELFPGLIPFASKWLTGFLDKNVYMNMSNGYLTTMYESIFVQKYAFLVEQ